MGPTPIPLGFLLTSLASVAALEILVAWIGTWMDLPRLWLLTVDRIIQTGVILTLAAIRSDGLASLGLKKKMVLPGLKKGLIWSAGFAGVAGILFIGFFAAGQNPLMLIRSPLPQKSSLLVLFFLTGGIIAPVFEEIVFRGLIFGYLRQWNTTVALLFSTAIFAVFHLPTIPVTQVVGGIVFAIAYCRSNSLVTPIFIHLSGNLAIFTLSLPLFQ